MILSNNLIYLSAFLFICLSLFHLSLVYLLSKEHMNYLLSNLCLIIKFFLVLSSTWNVLRCLFSLRITLFVNRIWYFLFRVVVRIRWNNNKKNHHWLVASRGMRKDIIFLLVWRWYWTKKSLGKKKSNYWFIWRDPFWNEKSSVWRAIESDSVNFTLKSDPLPANLMYSFSIATVTKFPHF